MKISTTYKIFKYILDFFYMIITMPIITVIIINIEVNMGWALLKESIIPEKNDFQMYHFGTSIIFFKASTIIDYLHPFTKLISNH